MYVSYSLFPQRAAPPGYWVPMSMIQFEAEGRALVWPVKVSRKVGVKPGLRELG